MAPGMAYLRAFAPLLVGLLTVVILALTYHLWQPWVALHTGSQNNSSTPPNYNYWSGFGSVFPWSMGVFTGIWTSVYQKSRKENCHAHGCWRIGSYPVEDYRVCKKHHNEVKGTHPTIEYLKEVHRGGSGNDQGVDSQSDLRQCATCIVNVGGVPGHNQPADAAGDSEGSGS